MPSTPLPPGLLQGKARLENLSVRPEAPARLGLPVRLNAGNVGSIDLVFPRSPIAMRSTPLRLTISNVYISVSPTTAADFKRASLAEPGAAADIDEAAADDDDDGTDWDSALGRLLDKVLDNVCITLIDVHVRVEDQVTGRVTRGRGAAWQPGRRGMAHAYALGFTLDQLTLRSAVSDGSESEGADKSSASTLLREGCSKDNSAYLNKILCVRFARPARGSVNLSPPPPPRVV